MTPEASPGDPLGLPLLQTAIDESPIDMGYAGLHVVLSQSGVWALADLLLGEREHPVVVLTQSEETLQPVLSPPRIRAIVGPHAPIRYLPGEYLLEALRVVLGNRLAVCRGAARIFWPGLWRGADPADHPLVQILDGELEADAHAEFARQFDLSRPPVRREIKLIEDARSVMQSELADTARELSRATEQLRDANIQRHEAIMRAERAEVSPRSATSAASWEERLHVLITEEWVRMLPAADRRQRPLGGYVLTQTFLAAVQSCQSISLERLARACAMVACGYASVLQDIAPRPLPEGRGVALRLRGDGAEGWCCNVPDETPEPPRLYYWIRSDQTIEFVGIERGE